MSKKIKNSKLFTKEYFEKIKRLSEIWNLSIEETKDEIISNLNWIKDEKLFNNIVNKYKKTNTVEE